MPVLYGLHDLDGYKHVPVGGWCVDTVALSENPRVNSYRDVRSDINWLVRLNWGYGSTGTIPELHNLDKYVDLASKYAIQSDAYGYIVANEVNHESERPNGVFITPEHYAECFSRTRNLIKTVSPEKRVIVAGMAPYHPTNMPKYLKQTLWEIEKRGGCDGVAIHAYARGVDPTSITSVQEMIVDGDPQYNGFMTYRDAIDSIPESMADLPCFITEFNPLPDWQNQNTGLIQAAYSEVDWWNRQPGSQKIFCLCLFRWKSYENQAWGIENKHAVLTDFQWAVQRNYQTPSRTVPVGVPDTSTPIVVVDDLKTPKTPSSPVFRALDARALKRGVGVDEVALKQGETGWIAKKVRWIDENESQGRHHFYFDTLDENGVRISGVPIRVSWPSGEHIVTSEAKPGEPWSTNFPMTASRNEFSARVLDGKPSDVVFGVGMGADTPSGFNAGIHTSTEVIFQRVKMQDAPDTPKQPPVGGQNVPQLVHPVAKEEFRRITQRFGENPAIYSKFKVDGVALKGHNGLDFGTPINSEIHAVDDGKVVEVASDPTGFGLYVKLQHTWGQTLYAHLNKQLVAHGEMVFMGSAVGLSGNSGHSTGPHLHFGMRVQPFNRQDGWGGYTDPLPYLSGAVTAPKSPEIPVENALMIAAEKTGLDWELLASLAMAESSWNARAKSEAGAQGLMQIMPATWAEWAPRVGVKDPFNAQDSALVGASYLKWLLDYYQQNLYKALCAYNAGPGNVDRQNVSDETLLYASRIIFGYQFLKKVNA